MRTMAICLAVGAVIVLIAFMYGKQLANQAAKLNAQNQVIIQGQTNDKVSNYTDNDYCARALHGKLSNTGECE